MSGAPLTALAGAPRRAAVIADFDGSVAPIVADPAAAVALPAAVDALEALTTRVGTVAIVSGRPVEFLSARLPLPGLVLVGQYGLERLADGHVVTDPAAEPFVDAVAEAAAAAELAWPDLHVERKGRLAVTLHWRRAPDRGLEAAAWADELGGRLGLSVVPGRMARELRPPVAIDKGTAVETLVADRDTACFAGDDHGDLAAFDALDRLERAGRLRVAVRIAVGSPEAPRQLVERGDVVVDGPPGLAALLAAFATSIS